MKEFRRHNDAVHFFIDKLTARIVAQSSPHDRYHMGKILLQSFKDDPEFLSQIDGQTGDNETNGSVLRRSVQCATAFRNFGLKLGDVVVLAAPSHIDLAIPLYAALYLGIIVQPVDKELTFQELKNTFDISKPKLIFCQSNKAESMQEAVNVLNLDTQIITFDKSNHCSFNEFLEKYGDGTSVEDFKAEDFKGEHPIAVLMPTSGTTGFPKAAALTHKNIAIGVPYLWIRHLKFPTPTKLVLVGSPLQWLTAIMQFTLSPILRVTRLQTSIPSLTPEHLKYLIHTYRPTFTITSPTMVLRLIEEDCDFTSLETVYLGGSALPIEVVEKIKSKSPNTEVLNAYGMTELSTVGFQDDNSPLGACGRALGCFQYRLVDIDTQEDIVDQNVQGELWIKGPAVFKEYYKNPKATAETFAEDGWFRTGDIFYRDQHWNYFFVERMKLLLKYNGHQISPVEIEGIIRHLPGVSDVAVAGYPDPVYGELPVACVVLRHGHHVTADQIKELVQSKLSDAKRLRGGVIFLPELPTTTTSKIHRRKLKEIVLSSKRE